MKSLSATELGTVGLASAWLEEQTPAIGKIREQALKARLEDALDRAELVKSQRLIALNEAAENLARAIAAEIRARDELVAAFPEAV